MTKSIHAFGALAIAACALILPLAPAPAAAQAELRVCVDSNLTTPVRARVTLLGPAGPEISNRVIAADEGYCTVRSSNSFQRGFEVVVETLDGRQLCTARRNQEMNFTLEINPAGAGHTCIQRDNQAI